MSTDARNPPDVPRDPSHYRPTNHFSERFHDRYDQYNRHLDGDIVRRCIEDGVAERHGGDNIRFRETIGGVTYRLVVSLSTDEVVTAYPISINTEAARESGRWSTRQIEDIRAFLTARPDGDPR